jgi:asparagine synthase (glutamine-hydrolysing)
LPVFRYVVFAWNPAERVAGQTARLLTQRMEDSPTSWAIALSTNAVTVLCTSHSTGTCEHRPLKGQRGVILGSLFKQSAAAAKTSTFIADAVDSSDSAAIMASAGRYLVQAYWGSYVAILNDPMTDSVHVLRSPLGNLPCLTTEYRGVHVFFSSVTDCLRLGVSELTVNWRYLAGHMCGIRQTGETGFNEIAEIPCGEAAEISAGRLRRHLYWDPLEIAHRQPVEDVQRATQALYETVTACIQSWAACHERIVHLLSGGLDSSIVLTCLRNAPSRPAITCVTRHFPAPDSDEREFARTAAAYLDCELVELPWRSTFSIEGVLEAALSERPQFYVGQLDHEAPEIELAQQRRASALFSGIFGDQVFHSGHAALTAADYIHDHGLRLGMFRRVANASEITGRSVWSVSKEAVSKGARRYRWDPLEAERYHNTLINEPAVRALQESDPRTTPWYHEERYVPPGKQAHIFAIRNPDDYYRPFARPGEPIYLAPLLSQPLVELCLRTPTYVLCQNGWDRYLARKAFGSVLPSAIARRRSKGGIQRVTAELYQRNLDFLRELMLNGELVSRGLLNRGRLAEALSGRPSNALKGTGMLSHFICIEVWLKLCSKQRAGESQTCRRNTLEQKLFPSSWDVLPPETSYDL